MYSAIEEGATRIFPQGANAKQKARIEELEDALHVILAMSDIKYVHEFCSKKLEETEAAK